MLMCSLLFILGHWSHQACYGSVSRSIFEDESGELQDSISSYSSSLNPEFLIGPSDTALVKLTPLDIPNSRLKNFSVGTKHLIYDSLVLAQFKNRSLGDLLAAESSMYIKSYGLGSLATSSFRGGNASQTAVLWNGFSLNSSMNGVLDFALVPSSFFNRISIQYGGETAQWGSGALGGSIHLNNSKNLGKGNDVTLGSEFGSFGRNNQSCKVELSKEKHSFSLSLFRAQAENNFPFFKQFQGRDSLVTQQNANYLGVGLLSDFQYEIKSNKKLEVAIWFQNIKRKIPPTSLQLESKAEQEDANLRVMFDYLWFKKKNKLQVKGAFFNEQLTFQDDIASILSENSAKSFLTEVTYDRSLSSVFQFSGGLYNSYVLSETTNYESRVDENRLSLYSFIKYQGKRKKLFFVFSSRATLVGDVVTTPTFSLQQTLKLNSLLQIKAKLATVYRLPTLNDKYWNPGGNLDLLPEKGLTQEIGVVTSTSKKRSVYLHSEITVFNKSIKNWIAWMPNGSVWSPQNLLRVWSRGVESISSISYTKKDLTLNLKLMTNYVLSTNQEVPSDNDNSLDKQLIYVPRYTGFANLSISKKNYSVSYRHNYTGYSYTSSDNVSFLTPFDVASLYVSYSLGKSNCLYHAYCSGDNIWGKEYVRIASRPMPLVNYSFGLNIKWHQVKKQANRTDN